MSFGFSISDFVALARCSWLFYDAIRTGPKECQAFSRELLQFHLVLKKFGENIRNMDRDLERSDIIALSELYFGCHDLLYCDIANTYDYPIARGIHSWTPTYVETDLSQRLKDRFHAANFVRKIPKLQRQVAAHIAKVTSYNVLTIMYYNLLLSCEF